MEQICLMGSCEHGNEASGSINCGEVGSDYEPLKTVGAISNASTFI